MGTAKQHYDQLLGEHYAWSVAAGADPFDRAAAWLTRHHLDGFARYLDLGTGFGAHAVPLHPSVFPALGAAAESARPCRPVTVSLPTVTASALASPDIVAQTPDVAASFVT